MSLLNVASIDKKIIKHLKNEGSITDYSAQTLIRQLLRESLENEKMSSILTTSMCLNEDLLCNFYTRSIEELMPEPVINHGGLILPPTLILLDDDNILDVGVMTRTQVESGLVIGSTEEERYVQALIEFSKELHKKAVSTNRNVSLHGSSGCAACLIFLLISSFFLLKEVTGI